jgi:Zn-dependent peptidase ImmA (M78 family)/transcriptional regulator with XRE-family HTH domain
MLEARITGEVLQWARERRELTYDQVAEDTNVPVGDLVAWERGASFPPFALAESLAHYFRIPFGFLFLSVPPVDSAPIPDFRTLAGQRPRKLSPDFLEVLSEVRLKQDWYREFAEQNLASPIPFVGSANTDAGHQEVARSIRQSLGITNDLRKQCKDWAAFLRHLCEAAQGLGILVMRSGVVKNDSTRALKVSEFRGFALSDVLAPVVFVNSKDSRSAQIFTLVHEIAHLWLGRTGISDADPSGLVEGNVENFCNAVAAEVLVPRDEFDQAWSAIRERSGFEEKLSRQFWVSPLVVIRRAFDLSKIAEEEFYRLVRTEKNKPIAKRRKSGGDPLKTLIARNGRRFTKAVVSAVREDLLTYKDGARLLGISNKFFPDVLGKRLE